MTRQQWNATHTQAEGYTDGTGYKPLLSDGQPTYAGVCCDERITSYEVVMPLSTSLEEARARAAEELPVEAEASRVVDRRLCQLQTYRHPAIAEALDGFGTVVAIYKDVPDQPSDYRHITITLGQDPDPASYQC